VVFQASKPKGEKRSHSNHVPFLMHSSKEIPFLQLVFVGQNTKQMNLWRIYWGRRAPKNEKK